MMASGYQLVIQVCICFLYLARAVPVVPMQNITCSESSSASQLRLWKHLPREWCEICLIDHDVDHDVDATVMCHVTPGDQAQWRLDDLATSLAEAVDSMGIEVAVDIHCATGGNISLPLPMRAPGLVKLRVHNCRLLDKLANCKAQANLTDESQKDWLRELEIDSCTWETNPLDLDLCVIVSEDFECGQDSTLVTFVYRNNSEVETPTMNSEWHSAFGNQSQQGGSGWSGEGRDGDPVSEEAAVSLEYLQQQIKQEEIGLQLSCHFLHLEVLDESFNEATTSNTYFEMLARNNRFPKLAVLNYTSTGLTYVPKELRESRRKFRGSKLGIIDLSHNWIQEVFPIAPCPSRGIPTTLILHFNNITTISFAMFKKWAKLPEFYVDIRHNPIACGCHLRDLVDHLGNDSQWGTPTMAYYKRQLSVMKCATPPQLSGKVIGSLRREDLPCLEAMADLRRPMAASLAVASLLMTLLVLAVRYRREVRILMYTRVHTLLPCTTLLSPSTTSSPNRNSHSRSRPEKTYDAFVAYAHQDSAWVLDSLLPRLEGASSVWGLPPCRLCIHQRDFVVGKPIVDNIIDCIAASRHTVGVVSNAFVQSGWAMEELQQAYHQSLQERRRRHLVLVMLEDVPRSEMAPVLRRCCKTFTYIHASDFLFWDRLLYSIHVNNDNIRTSKPPPLTTTTTAASSTQPCDALNNDNTNINTDTHDEDGRSKQHKHSTKDGSAFIGKKKRISSCVKNGGRSKGDNSFQKDSDNKGNNRCCEEGKVEDTSQMPPQEEGWRRVMFTETTCTRSGMSSRTSSTSTSDSCVPLTPSQFALDRPLFEDV